VAENTLYQLTDLLPQFGLNPNTLVPVIEAWDGTLTEYDAAPTTEFELRGNRLQKLSDMQDRIRRKQHSHSSTLPLPQNVHRTKSLAKRMDRIKQRSEKLQEGINTLQQQQDAVRALLDSMGNIPKKQKNKSESLESWRSNARAMIRSTLADQQRITHLTAVEPAATEEVASQIDFTHTASAEEVARNPSAQEEVIHLNTNGMHWPKLAGARGAASTQKFRDHFFHEPVYQKAYGFHQ
jgi:hypothetical protein